MLAFYWDSPGFLAWIWVLRFDWTVHRGNIWMDTDTLTTVLAEALWIDGCSSLWQLGKSVMTDEKLSLQSTFLSGSVEWRAEFRWLSTLVDWADSCRSSALPLMTPQHGKPSSGTCQTRPFVISSSINVCVCVCALMYVHLCIYMHAHKYNGNYICHMCGRARTQPDRHDTSGHSTFPQCFPSVHYNAPSSPWEN